MTVRWTLMLGVASLLAVACGGGVSLGTVPGAVNTDQDPSRPSAAAGPYDITCTMYFQPAANGREESISFRSDAAGLKTVAFPGLTLDVELAQSSTSSEATLTVTVPQTKTVQRFPLVRDRRPAQEFAGGHGFTGLVYLPPDVQYICKASPVDAPVDAAPAEGGPAPFDVACVAEVRSVPGGNVERSETFDLLAHGENKELDLGGFGLRFFTFDEAGEARSISVRAWKAPNTEATADIAQLFQLDRTVPITNHLGGTFTGQTTLVSSDRELTYSCKAR